MRRRHAPQEMGSRLRYTWPWNDATVSPESSVTVMA